MSIQLWTTPQAARPGFGETIRRGWGTDFAAVFAAFLEKGDSPLFAEVLTDGTVGTFARSPAGVHTVQGALSPGASETVTVRPESGTPVPGEAAAQTLTQTQVQDQTPAPSARSPVQTQVQSRVQVQPETRVQVQPQTRAQAQIQTQTQGRTQVQPDAQVQVQKGVSAGRTAGTFLRSPAGVHTLNQISAPVARSAVQAQVQTQVQVQETRVPVQPQTRAQAQTQSQTQTQGWTQVQPDAQVQVQEGVSSGRTAGTIARSPAGVHTVQGNVSPGTSETAVVRPESGTPAPEKAAPQMQNQTPVPAARSAVQNRVQPETRVPVQPQTRAQAQTQSQIQTQGRTQVQPDAQVQVQEGVSSGRTAGTIARSPAGVHTVQGNVSPGTSETAMVKPESGTPVPEKPSPQSAATAAAKPEVPTVTPPGSEMREAAAAVEPRGPAVPQAQGVQEPIARQVVYRVLAELEQLRGQVGKVVRLELRLNPPELGKVVVRLIWQTGGLEARFLAGDQTVRGAIEQSLPQLREALGRQDVNLLDVSADLAGENDGEPMRREPRGGRLIWNTAVPEELDNPARQPETATAWVINRLA